MNDAANRTDKGPGRGRVRRKAVDSAEAPQTADDRRDVAAALRVTANNGVPSGETTWAELFRKNNEALVSYLTHKLGGDRQEANDVAQEAYSKILGLDDVGAINHLRAYLFRTARNIAIDRLRKETRNPVTYCNDEFVSNIKCDTPPADQMLIAKERIRLIRLAVTELSPRRRYIFLRHRLYNESYATLAERTGLSESMVRKHVIRAMRHCKAYLDRKS